MKKLTLVGQGAKCMPPQNTILEYMKNVIHLDLSQNKIKRMEDLSKYMPKLQSLNICSNEFTELEEILVLRNHPNLRDLDFRSNPMPILSKRSLLMEQMFFTHQKDFRQNSVEYLKAMYFSPTASAASLINQDEVEKGDQAKKRDVVFKKVLSHTPRPQGNFSRLERINGEMILVIDLYQIGFYDFFPDNKANEDAFLVIDSKSEYLKFLSYMNKQKKDYFKYRVELIDDQKVSPVKKFFARGVQRNKQIQFRIEMKEIKKKHNLLVEKAKIKPRIQCKPTKVDVEEVNIPLRKLKEEQKILQARKSEKIAVKEDDDVSTSSGEECEQIDKQKIASDSEIDEKNNDTEPEYIQYEPKIRSSSVPNQNEEDQMTKYFPSFHLLPPKTRMKLLEDMFEGKNESIIRRKRIIEQNKKLIEDLQKQGWYEEPTVRDFQFNEVVHQLRESHKKYSSMDAHLKYLQRSSKSDKKYKLGITDETSLLNRFMPIYRDNHGDNESMKEIQKQYTPENIRSMLKNPKLQFTNEEFRELQQYLDIYSKIERLPPRAELLEWWIKMLDEQNKKEQEHKKLVEEHQSKMKIFQEKKAKKKLERRNEQIIKSALIATANLKKDFGNNYGEFYNRFHEQNPGMKEYLESKRQQKEQRTGKKRGIILGSDRSGATTERQSVAQTPAELASSVPRKTDSAEKYAKRMSLGVQAIHNDMRNKELLVRDNFATNWQNMTLQRWDKPAGPTKMQSARLQGSIKEIWPKYEELLNKQKLPFYPIRKFEDFYHSKDKLTRETSQKELMLNQESLAMSARLKAQTHNNNHITQSANQLPPYQKPFGTKYFIDYERKSVGENKYIIENIMSDEIKEMKEMQKKMNYKRFEVEKIVEESVKKHLNTNE